jgi:hypothetical protein
VNSRRQIDLHGSISARNAAGRTLQFHCAGSQITIDADSLRAALSAFSTIRASAVVEAAEPRALARLDDFRIELCIGGRRVGRAGAGARASRLARVFTKLPVELDLLALLKAGLTAF